MAKSASKKTDKSLIGLSDMTIDELKAKSAELKKSINKTKLEISVRKSKNHRLAFNLRKELSRCLTVLQQKNRV